MKPNNFFLKPTDSVRQKRMQNKGKSWDETEESKLMYELSMHYSIEKIAMSHGRSVRAIQMRLGYMLHKQKHLSMTELTQKFNLSETQIQEFLTFVNPTPKSNENYTNVSQQLETIFEKLDRIDHKIGKLYKMLSK